MNESYTIKTSSTISVTYLISRYIHPLQNLDRSRTYVPLEIVMGGGGLGEPLYTVCPDPVLILKYRIL